MEPAVLFCTRKENLSVAGERSPRTAICSITGRMECSGARDLHWDFRKMFGFWIEVTSWSGSSAFLEYTSSVFLDVLLNSDALQNVKKRRDRNSSSKVSFIFFPVVIVGSVSTSSSIISSSLLWLTGGRREKAPPTQRASTLLFCYSGTRDSLILKDVYLLQHGNSPTRRKSKTLECGVKTCIQRCSRQSRQQLRLEAVTVY